MIEYCRSGTIQCQSKWIREEGNPPHNMVCLYWYNQPSQSSDPPQRTVSVSGDDAPPHSECLGRNRNRFEWTPDKDSPSNTALSRPLHFHSAGSNPNHLWLRIRMDWKAEDCTSSAHNWLLRCVQTIQAHLQFTTQINSHSQSSHPMHPGII